MTMSEDVLPTPPASPSASTTTPDDVPSSSPSLHGTLDSLLERYLHLLDEQQKLQEQLGDVMSAGFFSLARANQSCSPGRWYGEDYYDERMKALRTVLQCSVSTLFFVEMFDLDGRQVNSYFCFRSEITPREPSNHAGAHDMEPKDKGEDENEGKPKTTNRKHTDCASRSPTLKNLSVFRTTATTTNNINKPSTPDTDTSSTDDPQSSQSDEKETAEKAPGTSASSEQHSVSRDPLRWFGVLVPPALRSAQASFVSAVEGPVPKLASVIAEMREVEGRVNEVRRLLAAASKKSEPERKAT